MQHSNAVAGLFREHLALETGLRCRCVSRLISEKMDVEIGPALLWEESVCLELRNAGLHPRDCASVFSRVDVGMGIRPLRFGSSGSQYGHVEGAGGEGNCLLVDI